MKRIILIAALSLMTSAAYAQQAPAAAPATAGQKPQAAAVDIDPNSAANGALMALRLIDQGKTAELWDNASAAARAAVQRGEFLQSVETRRRDLGTPVARAWTAVRRQTMAGDGKQVPAGNYITVEFSTRFSSSKVVKEMVSLRHDEDGKWRFTGYITG